MGSPYHDLLSAPELWQGAAAGLVAADAVVLAPVLAGRGPSRSLRQPLWAAPVLSVVAAFAVYVTVPDTEHALAVLGATSATASVALVFRRSWPGPALLVTLALIWVAFEDGWARQSALVGALAIALLHVLLQHRLVTVPARADAPIASLALAVGTMGLAARVAGRGDGLARPLIIAAVLVVATQATSRGTTRRSLRR